MLRSATTRLPGLALWAALALAVPQAEAGTAGAATPDPTAGTARAPSRFDAVFDIYLGGLWLAEMEVAAELGGPRYSAQARLSTAGVLGAFYRGFFDARTEGRRTGGAGWLPERFTADSGTSSKRQFLALDYGAGVPARLEAEPPFQPKPWEIDPRAQADALDPLSGALSALAAQTEAGLCNRRVEIFDGRRRYAIALGAPRADGGGRRCGAVYSRVAGFKPKMMKKPDFPFDVWFARGADGLWHVERAMGETSLGVAVIRRR